MCGTWDHNKQNEYLTPLGDLQPNTNLFGNHWKLQKTCRDEPENATTNPCDNNPTGQAQAQKYCTFLKGDAFKRESYLSPSLSHFSFCLFSSLSVCLSFLFPHLIRQNFFSNEQCTPWASCFFLYSLPFSGGLHPSLWELYVWYVCVHRQLEGLPLPHVVTVCPGLCCPRGQPAMAEQCLRMS